MSNIVKKNELNTPAISLGGQDNTNIGLVNNLDLKEYHYEASISRTFLPLGFKARNDAYSILACEYDDDNAFVLRINKAAVAKDSDTSLVSSIFPFDSETNKKIAPIPTLVMRPFKTPDSEEVLIGYVTSVNYKTDDFELGFFLLAKIPLKLIYDNFDALGVVHAPLRHHLENQIWMFKQGDIRKILNSKGILLPII